MTIAALMFFLVFFATLFGKRVKQGDLELIVSEPYHVIRLTLTNATLLFQKLSAKRTDPAAWILRLRSNGRRLSTIPLTLSTQLSSMICSSFQQLPFSHSFGVCDGSSRDSYRSERCIATFT